MHIFKRFIKYYPDDEPLVSKHVAVKTARNKVVDGLGVGIATRYGLDGPGIEFRWGTRVSIPVQTGPGAHPASYTMYTGSFTGVKRPGRGVDHPPHLATKLMKDWSYTSTLPLSLRGLYQLLTALLIN